MSTGQVVRAGPATALLDGSFLRRIKVGPHEVVRGVYAAGLGSSDAILNREDYTICL